MTTTIQKEEEADPTADVDNGDDSIGEESFQTCGNDQSAQADNEQQPTQPLNLGETTPTDTTTDIEESIRICVNPSTPAVKKKATSKESACDAPQIPSFIKVGLEKKQSPRAIKSWAAMALTLDGRDKITKVIQYTTRFLGWYLAGGSFKTQSLRFTALYKALANSRKAFRLGRSLIEIEKLRPVPGMIVWHLQNEEDQGSGSTDSKHFDEEQKPRRSLLRSCSTVAYQKMYRPLLSRMSSTMLPDDEPNQELWKICGMSIKIMGLLLFWAGDNCNFLVSTGAFDDYNVPVEERMKRRKQRQTYFSTKASKAYFVGSLAGLVVNWYAYLKFHRESIARLQNEDSNASNVNTENWSQKVKQLKQKQFSLLLSLLKSCCDVTVFSNQPGIDLHKKWRGKKNHEGIHCMCGLISAGTVIYNNFPDSK
ncbi:unnamed protein product [Cylindrotheca closterium]|uniref:Uncharacterized protein n=1 Tax=Cylindrotheca closterium TaxID=2856 RepID=A0AAD2CGK6_9STRA|nr:unnamed protein product [Cylindrotheca closterium]